jgi:hypothetical protein
MSTVTLPESYPLDLKLGLSFGDLAGYRVPGCPNSFSIRSEPVPRSSGGVGSDFMAGCSRSRHKDFPSGRPASMGKYLPVSIPLSKMLVRVGDGRLQTRVNGGHSAECRGGAVGITESAASAPGCGPGPWK